METSYKQIPHIRTDDERKYVHASTHFRIKVGGQVERGIWTHRLEHGSDMKICSLKSLLSALMLEEKIQSLDLEAQINSAS